MATHSVAPNQGYTTLKRAMHSTPNDGDKCGIDKEGDISCKSSGESERDKAESQLPGGSV